MTETFLPSLRQAEKARVGLACLAASLMLAACDPISLTMLGVGTGAGVAHQMGGMAYKTFTEPMPKVKRAAIAALGKMAIKVSSTEKIEHGEMIKARAADRNIEIELEALTPATTRIKVVARRESAIVVDSEIGRASCRERV